uniref:Chorion peroxidase n=1 Tax=Ceratitis capitata TaxID=7213 RepID=W8BSG2_CERCA
MWNKNKSFSAQQTQNYINFKSTFLIIIIYSWILIADINGKNVNEGSFKYLESISAEEWKRDLEFGIESFNAQIRLEKNLINSHVSVENGSISHNQILDALPNEAAKMDNNIARKLLAASNYILHSKCLPHFIQGEECQQFLTSKAIPENSLLLQECLEIIENRRNGHNSFRRLLNRRYNDGIYQILPLISPLMVSTKLQNLNLGARSKELEDRERNMAVIQWTQFIEHDLSKPVVTTMRDGSYIECCDRDNFELLPRYRHPSCEPLVMTSGGSKYAKINCLNYVRSAVAVGAKCTFGDVEQLNQATSDLDLSQLYGTTDEAQNRIRSFFKGQIKSSGNGRSQKRYNDQLPLINEGSQKYCAFKNHFNHTGRCFMAGDSRVNSSPLTISIYTLFMRNHNQIAEKLAIRYPSWSDEDLFQTTRALNTQIYRNIIYDELLPIVLGRDVADKIKQGSFRKAHVDDERISNEFSVAAMRFYLSMMPNFLKNSTEAKRLKYSTYDLVSNPNSNIFRSETAVSLIDQMYKPNLAYTHKEIDTIFESILNQSAMKLDTIYEDSLILNDFGINRPNHSDVLAYDIQRGRDHGLRSYIDYLELATGEKIESWKDLESFISATDLRLLKSIYNDVKTIDLLVGAMAEKNELGAIVGPTFKYILAEQFSQIYQKQKRVANSTLPEFQEFKMVSAVDLLCANTELQEIQRNLFSLTSDKNLPITCDERVKLLRV